MDTCSFTDNAGLCGIPGLPTCGHLSAGAKVSIGLGASFVFLLLITGSVCWWKRRKNILRAQQIAGMLYSSFAGYSYTCKTLYVV